MKIDWEFAEACVIGALLTYAVMSGFFNLIRSLLAF